MSALAWILFVCFFFKGCFKLLSECGSPPSAARHARSEGSRVSQGGWRRGEQGTERAGEARLAGSLPASGQLLSDLLRRFHQDALRTRLSVGLFPQHYIILIKEDPQPSQASHLGHPIPLLCTENSILQTPTSSLIK